MSAKKTLLMLSVIAAAITVVLLYNEITNAHCDTLDGPVVAACVKSFESGNINYTLIWVQEKDEQLIKDAFNKALNVRKLGGEAKELAEMNFFETVVRVHRSGEGAPYDGLKPAGLDLGPAIPAGDKAIDSKSIDEVQNLLINTMKERLDRHYKEVMDKKNYDVNNVKAGREYVEAYVEYIHFVERIYQSCVKTPEGHFDEHEVH